MRRLGTMFTRTFFTAVSFLLVGFCLTLLACSDDAVAPVDTDQQSEQDEPLPTSPTNPAPPSETEAVNCAGIAAWCPTPIVEPKDPYVAAYLGVQQQCYCGCDINGKHLDCAAAPNGPADCGVIKDQATNPDGSITFKDRFFWDVNGFPLVCRYSMITAAY
jgi:hypothetical protein